jgi:hypothetical protein
MMWHPIVFNFLLACVLWGLLGCGVPRSVPMRAAPPPSEDRLRAQAEEDCRFYRLQSSPAPSREETCIQSRIEAMQAIAAMQSDPDFAAAQQACAFFRGSPREDVCYRTRIGEQRMGLVEMWRAVLTQPREVVRALPAGSNALECGRVNGTYTCAPSTRRSTVITRANPDGTITYQVPQTAPSPGVSGVNAAQGGPCDEKPWDPTEVYSAKDAYYASLARLRSAPTDPKCREQALHFGRLFSSFPRGGYVTTVDEVSIVNDVNAATGGSVDLVPRPGQPIPGVGGTP